MKLGIGLSLANDRFFAGIKLFINKFSGASLALSLRLVNFFYKGFIITVRRSSDNLQRGFYAGEIIGTAMRDWVNTPVAKFQSDFGEGGIAFSNFNLNTVMNQAIGGKDEVLKVILTGGNNIHYLKNNGVVEVGRNFNFLFDIYIPSSNSVVNQVNVNRPFDIGYLSPPLDTWASYSFTGISEYDDIQLISASGDSINIDADGDVFYLKNITLAQLTADGFVPTIFDQIFSNNMNQPLSSLQGSIMLNGEVNLKGGKPCIIRSANDSGGYLSTYAPNDGATVKGMFYVGENGIDASARATIFGGSTARADYGFIAQSRSTSTSIDNSPNISLTKLNGSTTTIANRVEAYTETNNQFLLYREIDFDSTDNNLGLGYTPIGIGMFSFQELVIFENTDDAEAKENNINEYYEIF